MMVRRSLNSDQLGRKGEKRFEELCIDEGLVPNPSSWDRKGWDFIVEWPHTNVTASLDNRPVPLSCFVQSKAVWDTTESIRVRLSSVEAIAKDPKPAFIHVLQVSDALEFVGAFVLHLEGELLAHVLKRLRKAHVDGEPPNEVYVSLTLAHWGTSLQPTGLAFRQFAEQVISPSLEAYIDRKQRQLRTLGFEKGHLILRTTLEGVSVDQVTDAFLGIGRLDVKHSEVSEIRFGIPLSVPDLAFGSGEIEFQPKPRDKCVITVRRLGGPLLLRMKGKMYSLPSGFLSPDSMKVLIRTDLIDLMVRANDQGGRTAISLKLSMDRDKIGTARMPAAEWRDLYAFMLALFSENMEIEIQPSKIDTPISGTIRLDTGPEKSPDWEYAADLTRVAAEILERSSWPGTKLRLEEIAEAGREFYLLHAMMNSASDLTPLGFKSKLGSQPMPTEPLEILYFGYVPLKKYVVAYAAICRMRGYAEGDEFIWSGDTFNLREVSRIKPTVRAYENFISNVRRRTKIESYFAPSLRNTEQEPDQ